MLSIHKTLQPNRVVQRLSEGIHLAAVLTGIQSAVRDRLRHSEMVPSVRIAPLVGNRL